MKRVLPSALVGWFLNHAQKLEHPQLFKWITAIFLVDLIIPDLLPFADELLLGLAALYLGSRKKTLSTKSKTEAKTTKKTDAEESTQRRQDGD